MLRTEIRWSGMTMGAGLNVLNFDGAAEDVAQLNDLLGAVDDFVTAFSLYCPPGVSIQVSNQIEVVSESSGTSIATLSAAAQPAHPGAASSGPVAAGVGARVRWPTGTFKNGRPVTGTTFIVPLATSAFESNGTLTSACVAALQTAGEALLGAANGLSLPLGVWTRNSGPGVSDGVLTPATGVVVPDQVSWLTTRRT